MEISLYDPKAHVEFDFNVALSLIYKLGSFSLVS
jgi:hypothetical protein